MTLREFENGYWYLDQLKQFAERIGPSAKTLRNDEIEKAIVGSLRETGATDVDRGLQEFERVPHVRYINFVADFLEADTKATRAEAIAAWTELKARATANGDVSVRRACSCCSVVS
jgi:hypothetical protein